MVVAGEEEVQKASGCEERKWQREGPPTAAALLVVIHQISS